MTRFRITAFILSLLLIRFSSYGQSCSSLNIQFRADIPSTCNFMVMTMIHDANNQPYLYVANKEGGLKVYDISVITNPSLVATVPANLFDTLDVMNLSQNGNYLYLALGNSFTNPQKCGMAIVDVTIPTVPTVTDYYEVPASNSGGGIVKVEGNYAYLGAMQSGLVILDVTDKSNILFVSQFIPDINFPPVPNPNPNFYNARGMEIKNSIIYLCYDAGGIRIINCTNKLAPVETGHWCNPVMYTPLDHPKAYNNAVLNDTLLYVAVDYCGMEVLNVTDTSNITLLGWWNPYDCPNNNWFTSPVHTNEIQYDSNCKKVFLSAGKSDMMVIDVSNPFLPDSCNAYGDTANSIGTWGVNVYRDEIYLSYVCAVFPFPSNWTGVKLLTYTTCTVGIKEQNNSPEFSIYPNPSTGSFTILTDKPGNKKVKIYNSIGRVVKELSLTGNKISFERNNLTNGFYLVEVLYNDGLVSRAKLMLN